MPTAQTSEEYFEDWHPYDLLIKHNHMRHREIIERLKGRIHEDSSGIISILELGCGNAYVVKQAFGHLETVQYTGIDLSAQALRTAKENLKNASWDIRLIEGDIEKTIAELNTEVHMIIAGFSLHHFSEDSILHILKQAKSCLTENGDVFVYDVLTRENETRVDFNRRLVRGIDECQLGLSPDQSKSLSHHIKAYDFPIDFPHWDTLARNAGFAGIECLYRDEEEYYALLRISLSETGEAR